MKKKHIHDTGYKYLFSNKRIFYELIHYFVDEDFVKKIRYEDIELVDKSFVSDEFLQRESDIIYKINLDGNDIFIYVLLEFQSTVDKSIPVRMALYILQFYDLILRNSKKGKLPSVFPLLLYNGSKDWTVPKKLIDLIDVRIPEKYIPNFEYYIIVEKDIADSVLLQIKSLASAIIYLEKQEDEAGIKEAIDKIIELISEEDIIDMEVFAKWFKRVFSSSVELEDRNKITSLVEVNSMLLELVERI